MKLYGIRARSEWQTTKPYLYLVIVDRDGDDYTNIIRKRLADYSGKLARFICVRNLSHCGGGVKQYLTTKKRAQRTMKALKNVDGGWTNIHYFTASYTPELDSLEIYEVEIK